MKKPLRKKLNLVDSHGTMILMMMDRLQKRTGAYLKTRKETAKKPQPFPLQVRLQATKEIATDRDKMELLELMRMPGPRQLHLLTVRAPSRKNGKNNWHSFTKISATFHPRTETRY